MLNPGYVHSMSQLLFSRQNLPVKHLPRGCIEFNVPPLFPPKKCVEFNVPLPLLR